MRRAVICTAFGWRAVSTRNGKEFVITATPQQFTDGIFRLLIAPQKVSGQENLSRKYTWVGIGGQFRSTIKSLLKTERDLARETDASRSFVIRGKGESTVIDRNRVREVSVG
jgi:hypothetical protein